MKTKLLALMFIAGGSLFAESRFSISIGGYGPGYYAPPPIYYAPPRPHVLYRAYGPNVRGWGDANYGGYGAGYWGENPERRHERAEWYGLHNHQQGERYIYGNSEELREHQAQEQWHERNGDYDAADGPAHGSARDGWYDDHRH